MDHRHFHWTPHISGNNRDQSSNHMQGYYTPENGSLVFSLENGPPIGIVNRLPPWNPIHNLNFQMYAPNNIMGTPLFSVIPSHDPFRHPLRAGSFNPVTPVSYPGQASSSSTYERRIDDNRTILGGRGSYKRKPHGFSGVIFERGSSSGHSGEGSSLEQDATPPPNRPVWGGPPAFPNHIVDPGTPLPIPIQTGDQGSYRNVRSRVFYEPEQSLTRAAPFDILPTHHHHNHGYANPNTSQPTTVFSSPTVRGGFYSSDSSSGRGGGYSHGGCTQRPRASSSSSPWGSSFSEQQGLQLVGENNSYRNSRSNTGWRSSSRNTGRWYPRSGSDPPAFHRYPSTQSVLFFDYHRSRDSLDRHRDLRLDVDHMSYEELLALGERIGSVSTGLTEEMVSKCISDTPYVSCASSDDGEGTCSICLEEYEEGEMVGKVKKCGHEYHTGCIKKWLGLKNSCPICKVTAC